jgi:hypothetical protein
MKEVALAGRGETLSRTTTAATAQTLGGGNPGVGGANAAAGDTHGSVTSLASSNNHSTLSSGSGENFVLAKDHFASGGSLARPPVIRDPARTTKSGSPVRDSRFLEMME